LDTAEMDVVTAGVDALWTSLGGIAAVGRGCGVAPCVGSRVHPGWNMFALLVMGFPGAVECCNCVAA
jgi:hypothetical protein